MNQEPACKRVNGFWRIVRHFLRQFMIIEWIVVRGKDVKWIYGHWCVWRVLEVLGCRDVGN